MYCAVLGTESDQPDVGGDVNISDSANQENDEESDTTRTDYPDGTYTIEELGSDGCKKITWYDSDDNITSITNYDSDGNENMTTAYSAYGDVRVTEYDEKGQCKHKHN